MSINKSTLSVFFLLTGICGTWSCRAASETEVQALLAFLEATHGDTWLMKNGWNDSSTPTCSWFGIACDAGGNVTEIALRANNLVGALSTFDFRGLPCLETFDVSHNQLSGSINSSILSLPMIAYIDVSWNRLTTLLVNAATVVPASLSSMYLSHNDYRCPLPSYASLGNALQRVWLDVNETTCGSTPTQTLSPSLTAVAVQRISISPILWLELTTQLDLSKPNNTALFTAALLSVCVVDGFLPINATPGSLAGLVVLLPQTSSLMIVNFTDSAPLSLRQNIAWRFENQDPLILDLIIVSVTVIASISASPANTLTSASPVAPLEALAGSEMITVLIVGVALVVGGGVALASFFCCCRSRAITNVRQLQQQRPGPPNGKFSQQVGQFSPTEV